MNPRAAFRPVVMKWAVANRRERKRWEVEKNTKANVDERKI